jgi:hypothetical protein
MDWVAPRLTDGLGNRFFQIAAAIGAAEKLGRRPVLFLPRMSRYSHGNWGFVLRCVPDLEILETEAEWTEGIDEEIPKNTNGKGIVLRGWFQDLRYFPDLQNPLLPRYPGDIPAALNKVAVFFRFGDYCILQHHQQDLRKYYGEALSRFPKGTELILFSDSTEKLKDIQTECNEKGYPNVVCGSQSIESTIKMALMCTKGCIGANSTFSWWTAWFVWTARGRPAEYRAYFPEVWVQGHPAMNLFTLPYTECISTYPNNTELKSFHYH